MSQANVERYRQGIDAFNRRDLDDGPGSQGWRRPTRDHGRWPARSRPSRGAHPARGHDGHQGWWNGLLGVFPDFRIEIVWVRDAGNLTVSELRISQGSTATASDDAALTSTNRYGRRRSAGSAMDWRCGGRCSQASTTPSTLPPLATGEAMSRNCPQRPAGQTSPVPVTRGPESWLRDVASASCRLVAWTSYCQPLTDTVSKLPPGCGSRGRNVIGTPPLGWSPNCRYIQGGDPDSTGPDGTYTRSLAWCSRARTRRPPPCQARCCPTRS